jgi:hypothetical protein
VPVSDLHSERERGQRRPRKQPGRCTTGVNSLSPAIAMIALSSRSPRAVTASTRLVAGFEGHGGRGVGEALLTQPPVVRPGPGVPAGTLAGELGVAW